MLNFNRSIKLLLLLYEKLMWILFTNKPTFKYYYIYKNTKLTKWNYPWKNFQIKIDSPVLILQEWGWTARNSIARQSFARHFWQQINCSTQNLSTARIQLILAKPDSSKWQKKCQLLDSVEQLTLLSSVTYKLKKSIFYL